MNGSAQRRKRNKTHFEGKLEKRLRGSRPVYLARLEEPRARERTLKENVSAHGARVVSTQFWRPGAGSLITLNARVSANRRRKFSQYYLCVNK